MTGSFRPRVIARNYKLPNGRIPVREDEVQLGPGQRLHYLVLEYHNAVAVVVLTEDEQVLLVRVPRYPISEYLWELPGGKVDPGESPEGCAIRELEEETGYRVKRTEKLVSYYPEPSFSTERLDIFLASGPLETGMAQAEPEGLPEVRLFPLDRALDMVRQGEIKSSWSMIGLLLAADRIRRSDDV